MSGEEASFRGLQRDATPLVNRTHKGKGSSGTSVRDPCTPGKTSAGKGGAGHWPAATWSWPLDLNPIALHSAVLEAYFRLCGLESRLVDLDADTRMHCWVPAPRGAAWHPALWCGSRRGGGKEPRRQAILLLHGFGASGIWQWIHQILALVRAGVDVYMPDLVFFGRSTSSSPDRSEGFQAQCMARLMAHLGVTRFHVNGISYGGFVAYRLASMFPERVASLVLTSSGIMMKPAEYEEMLSHFHVADPAELLLPSDAVGVRRLLRMAYHPPPNPPLWLLEKTVPVLFSHMVQEKRELLEYLSKTMLNNSEELPRPHMDTLLVWGRHDRVFPVAIGERMQRAFGNLTQLVVLDHSSHLSNTDQADEYNQVLLRFLKKTEPSGLIDALHIHSDWFLKLVHVKTLF